MLDTCTRCGRLMPFVFQNGKKVFFPHFSDVNYSSVCPAFEFLTCYDIQGTFDFVSKLKEELDHEALQNAQWKESKVVQPDGWERTGPSEE